MCEVISIVDWIGKDIQSYSTYNLDSSREIIIKPIGTLKVEEACPAPNSKNCDIRTEWFKYGVNEELDEN